MYYTIGTERDEKPQYQLIPERNIEDLKKTNYEHDKNNNKC